MELSKITTWILPGLLALLAMPSAKADLAFDFTIHLTAGNTQGTVMGNLLLPFVSAGGSGTGAASVLKLTSIPSGFGTLASGNTITSWANQVSNSFTVTNGNITNFAYLAVTGPTLGDDAFIINSTTQTLGFGSWGFGSSLNALASSSVISGYNLGGLAGVTFTPSTPIIRVPPSAVPEPSSVGLALVCAVGLAAGRRRIPR